MKTISKAKRTHLLAVVTGRLCRCGQAATYVPMRGPEECEGCCRKRLGMTRGRSWRRWSLDEARRFTEWMWSAP